MIWLNVEIILKIGDKIDLRELTIDGWSFSGKESRNIFYFILLNDT